MIVADFVTPLKTCAFICPRYKSQVPFFPTVFINLK